MSLHSQEMPPLPEETARVARAILPQGTRYLLLREELGTIYSDELFTDVYPRWGQPAEQPWRLALVTVMQFMETSTDRQAAEAVRTRIDGKYV
jgi:transposase